MLPRASPLVQFSFGSGWHTRPECSSPEQTRGHHGALQQALAPSDAGQGNGRCSGGPPRLTAAPLPPSQAGLSLFGDLLIPSLLGFPLLHPADSKVFYSRAHLSCPLSFGYTSRTLLYFRSQPILGKGWSTLVTCGTSLVPSPGSGNDGDRNSRIAPPLLAAVHILCAAWGLYRLGTVLSE